MANIPRFATHNEYPNDSIEGMDLQHLLHPSTNLAQHQQHGPGCTGECRWHLCSR